jgi:hypothetical protein
MNADVKLELSLDSVPIFSKDTEVLVLYLFVKKSSGTAYFHLLFLGPPESAIDVSLLGRVYKRLCYE